MYSVGKRILAAILVLCLMQPVLPVWAEEENTEESTVPETTEAPEVTEIAEEPEETEIPEETENSGETEEPAETETPEETETTEELDAGPSIPPVRTVAEVLALEVGTENIRMEGVVVFAAGYQAILQDDTGGIRLAFSAKPGLAPGDLITVTGRRSGGFLVEDFTKTGEGPMPAVESGLDEDRSDLRILVRNAVLDQGCLTQMGYTYALEGSLPEGVKNGDRVDVWGVLLDGIFYADTILPASRTPEEEMPSGMEDWNFYFGQLHAHSEISDGTGTAEEAFAHAYGAEHLDFFALTDHSNSFDNAEAGSVNQDGTAISTEWAAGKAAAAAVTDETFVGIFGYEMTWQEELALGHINTFGTPGWQTRDQQGMSAPEAYLDALAQVPGAVSQFNHPGQIYGDFYHFSRYDPKHDQRVHLLEVGCGGNASAYHYYTKALDQGWHLAPSSNQNNHNGGWGTENSHRTAVLARELTEEAIYDAIRNYRVYATEDWDMKILYRLNGALMGSVMGETEELTATVLVEDPSDEAVGLVEVITDKGAVAASAPVEGPSEELTLAVPAGGSYYYLRITQTDGDIAVTAPVWLESYEDLGVQDFVAETTEPELGTETELILTLYNDETAEFTVDSVEFTAGEEVLATLAAPGTVEPAGTLEIPVTCISMEPGTMTVAARITGTVAGISRTYETSLTLYWQPRQAPLLPIEEVRLGKPGEAYRVRGYVTAGTTKAHNTFADSIYLQDDTGGIQIADFTDGGIQVGMPLDVEGILLQRGGNLMLALTDYEVRKEAFHSYTPRTMSNKTASDYEANGGELLQIEGSVVSVTKTANEKGVSRFTLRDIHGDLATVLVEAGIGSGAYGVNELASEVKTKRVVRAMGLVHRDEFGQSVLRVRNCDEVVYVPPRKDPTNPKTGDWLTYLKFWE